MIQNIHITEKIIKLKSKLKYYIINGQFADKNKISKLKSNELLEYFEWVNKNSKLIFKRCEQIRLTFNNFNNILLQCDKESYKIIKTILEYDVSDYIFKELFEINKLYDESTKGILYRLKEQRKGSRIFIQDNYNKVYKQLDLGEIFRCITIINDRFVSIYNEVDRFDKYIYSYIREVMLERMNNYYKQNQNTISIEIIKNIDIIDEYTKLMLFQIKKLRIENKNFIEMKKSIYARI
ncbi:hypothetical protein JHL18_17635 [Clostridium sp. YIM B02505]|uniref:Uncharacterized protein n=1 Tax=Clostridium yunnanense TaxID=2800325 RepID=A0ABS1ET18_9CLOT|nr:hypothetical protein [Clostridium yunnanense]MBK1812443.1 hypothetical protein [Clostridium yunnanense]